MTAAGGWPEPAADPQGLATFAAAVQLTGVTAGRDVSIRTGSVRLERPAVPRRLIRLDPRTLQLAGRDDLLADLRSRVAAPGPSPRLLALHGLGGVGKTSVAREFAHRHRDDYDLIWELAAEDLTVLSAGFGELAHQLGIRDAQDAANPVIQVQTVLAARPGGWLLLLDNVTDHAAIRSFLPPAGDGTVLVTSRSADWPPGVGLGVPVLELPAAEGYLRSHAPEEADVGPVAAEIAELLGRLPLALSQAAGYLRTSGRTLPEYLDLLRAHRARLLGRGEAWQYPARVNSTWDLAFQQLQADAPTAITLLRLLACWSPEDIPVRLLLDTTDQAGIADSDVAAALAPLRHDPIALDDALVALRRYSLIGPGAGGNVSVHRLVQAVTLDQLPGERLDAWRGAAAALVEGALPDDAHDPRNWPRLALLLPHARATLGPATEGVPRLVEYLDASGDYPTARAWQAEIHADRVGRHGPRHPDALSAQVQLAELTGLAGDPVAARELAAAVLPAAREVWGDDDPRTLRAAARHADWTGQAGDWPGARDLCAALLPVARRVLGDEHPETLWLWAERGFWIGQSGDPGEARRVYAELLPILERVLGPEHPDLLGRKDQYARWIGESGDPQAAYRECARVLAAHERIYGPHHPGSLWIRANLAWWTGEAGDAAGARDLFAAVLLVRAQLFGADHPATQVVRGNLAWWTGLAGDPAAARDQCAALLPVRQRVIGPDHPETLLTHAGLARWTGEAGDPVGATQHFATLVACYERLLGPDHPRTIEAAAELATWTARCST